LQATYILPTKTKLGLAYGVSKLDRVGAEADTLVKENERITLGLYHPLTKHLNLVAEYNDVSSKNHANAERDARTGSLGAILFF
jgi:predicted porin